MCTGFRFVEQVEITPSNYGMLDVDAGYQRGQTNLVQAIEAALRQGGSMPGAPILCRRPWSPKDANRLYIVDGFQRVAAAQRAGVSFLALVYESDSIDSEKKAFVILNDKRALEPGLIVKDWTGRASSSPRSPTVR